MFGAINDAVGAIASASRAGTSFVFGYLGGGALPFELKSPGAEFILAFQALPIVLVMSVLTTLLFYWRILPPIVRGMAWLLERTLGIGGAVGLSTAANIFLGMVEAPLFIRPYLAQLTRSEMFLVMTGGMAGIAGTVLVLYATLLAPLIPDAAGHFVIASVLGAPAAILISLIMVPETRDVKTGGTSGDPRLAQDPDLHATSTMDAIVKGTTSGLELLLNIVAMLLVLVALVHLANSLLGLLPDAGGPITLQRLLGYVMAPVCWLMGLPWSQAITAGSLMGTKTVLNELIAYVDFSKLPRRHARSALAADHALCDVRLRQFRQPRHHGRRPRHHGPGAPRRNQLARTEVDRLGHADDLPDGRDRRRADVNHRQIRCTRSIGCYSAIPQRDHPVHHVDGAFSRQMRVIKGKRNAAIERERTLSRRAHGIDDRDEGKQGILRRQCRLHRSSNEKMSGRTKSSTAARRDANARATASPAAARETGSDGSEQRLPRCRARQARQWSA